MQDGNIEGGVTAFQKALQLDPILDVNPETKARQLAASALVDQGETRAQDSKIKDAVTAFQKALQLDPSLDINPETKARQLAASVLVTQGEKLVQKDKIDDAVARFQTALQLDPSSDFDIKTKAASELIAEGKSSIDKGKMKEAITIYTKAQQLAPEVRISEDSWHILCWKGSVRGYAKEVMFTCDKAVTLAPENAWYRDHRGIARALVGNNKGAIEDFQIVIPKVNKKEKKLQRQRWVNDLHSGKNPFTPEDKKGLLNQ